MQFCLTESRTARIITVAIFSNSEGWNENYNIIEQWLKYHSYAYYRKACSNDDIHELFNLIGRIAEYQIEVSISDKNMKNILNGELIKPIR